MRHWLDCASDNSCVDCAACSSLIDRRDVIWSHLWILREKERAHAVIHSCCLWNYVSQKVFKLLYIYLMKKYELYLTFSIIIISLAPDRDWDGATAFHAKPLTAGASSAWDRFMTSAFLETADQTSQTDYRPIVIGSRSIGAPLIYIYTF